MTARLDKARFRLGDAWQQEVDQEPAVGAFRELKPRAQLQGSTLRLSQGPSKERMEKYAHIVHTDTYI